MRPRREPTKRKWTGSTTIEIVDVAADIAQPPPIPPFPQKLANAVAMCDDLAPASKATSDVGDERRTSDGTMQEHVLDCLEQLRDTHSKVPEGDATVQEWDAFWNDVQQQIPKAPGTAGAIPTPQHQQNIGRVLGDVSRLLKYGQTVTKHTRRSRPHARILFLDNSGRHICWQKVGQNGLKPKKPRCLPLSDVQDVVWGQTTAVFRRKHANKENECCCFSIVFSNRTLDIEAESEALASRLYNGLRLLCLGELPKFDRPPSSSGLNAPPADERQSTTSEVAHGIW